jgi:hypothetical protein
VGTPSLLETEKGWAGGPFKYDPGERRRVYPATGGRTDGAGANRGSLSPSGHPLDSLSVCERVKSSERDSDRQPLSRDRLLEEDAGAAINRVMRGAAGPRRDGRLHDQRDAGPGRREGEWLDDRRWKQGMSVEEVLSVLQSSTCSTRGPLFWVLLPRETRASFLDCPSSSPRRSSIPISPLDQKDQIGTNTNANE